MPPMRLATACEMAGLGFWNSATAVWIASGDTVTTEAPFESVGVSPVRRTCTMLPRGISASSLMYLRIVFGPTDWPFAEPRTLRSLGSVSSRLKMFVPADQTSRRRLNSRTNACWRAVRMKSESRCR